MLLFEIEPMIAQAGRDGLMKADMTRQLNDAFRTTFDGGKVILSAGVSALSEQAQLEVVWAVRLFWQFTPENDPHEEHDFGAVTCHGVRYFWKIDPYDLDLRFRSPDPSDAAFTIRVLTIMKADEY